MKHKIIAVFILLALALAAVQGQNRQSSNSNNILVVYFSRHGSSIGSNDTDAVSSASLSPGDAITVANIIKDASGADMFQIITVDPYPRNYRETTDVARREQRENARPALASRIENLDSYNTIILGYPNWWGTLPMPVAHFLESHDFSGKTIVPYCVHEGSRMGSSEALIAQLAPGATVKEGLAIRGNSAGSSRRDVEQWLRKNGLIR
ncbi:hypothetical protein K7I13_03820 [Brucepastera parasyntrophica]|uniref:flavodoxin n=1 Tax=Brucepastera parasyntrophica TaxID=2880008 RepID=UPI002108CB35|nr:flavodoxin [Brucepastera parasyntrophica]ULQ60447.1 hypothetical protein K7I13_03820 [Brucepastera parasyntrophica]